MDNTEKLKLVRHKMKSVIVEVESILTEVVGEKIGFVLMVYETIADTGVVYGGNTDYIDTLNAIDILAEEISDLIDGVSTTEKLH